MRRRESLIYTVDSAESRSFVIRATHSATGTDLEDVGVPEDFVLHQNYPNPFNPATTIRYSLPEATPVRITVYSALGKEVATLVQGTKAAGHHEATWDAAGFANGVYLYRIQAGSLSLTRTMLLLK